MSALAPRSRRSQLRRIAPAVVAMLLLLVVLASFLLVPPADGAEAAESPTAGQSIVPASEGHDCLEAQPAA